MLGLGKPHHINKVILDAMNSRPIALSMMKSNSTNHFFLLFCLFFSFDFFAMAQNTTFPINVGVILNLENWFGKMGISCINISLTDFYASHPYYSTRLVLHSRDSAEDVVIAAGAALDLINNVKVQAIIGPDSSMEAKFVNELGDRAQVPIISFSATSPSLENPYFFRIAQNDTSQVKAISDIIQAFGWSEVVPISVDNEFGNGIIPYLTTALQAVNVRSPYWVVIPSTATNEQIDAELDKLMVMHTRVFIVHMLPSLGSRLFARANAMGMMEEGFAWIMTTGMTNLLSSSKYAVTDNMQGALGLKTYMPNTEKLEKFRGRWQSKFQQDNPTLLNVKLEVPGLWAYDAAWALAMAVEKVETTTFPSQNINISGSSKRGVEWLEVSQSGPELLQQLSGTIFTGLSGDFSLVDRQLQSSTFQVVNVNENGARGVGYWTPQNGLVRNLNAKNTDKIATNTSNTTLGTIIWPGDTTTFPRGWQISTSNRLRVLVPVKKSFRELVQTTKPEPGINRVEAFGYCIEVFQAVIASLPYSVTYEFIPFDSDDGDDDSYNHLVEQVFLGNVDAAVGDITITARRSLYVDFTLPYTKSGISMIVPVKDKNDAESTWVFLKPLTWDLWVTFSCSFVFIGFLVWFLEHRINEDFRGSPLHQLGTGLWYSFSTMVFAHRERVVTNLARFIVIVWCFVVLILTQSYTASLSSMLTVQQLQPIITDVNLLIKNGDFVGYRAGSFIYSILKDTGFQEEKLRSYDSPEELYELLQNGNGNNGISAAFDETPYMKLFLSKYCQNYTMVEPTFITDGFAFVFQKGSLFARDFSTAITTLHEGTDMKKIENNWFRNSPNCSNPGSTATSSIHTLSLANFRGLFIFAGVAFSLALLIYVAMFFHEHRHALTRFGPETSFLSKIREVWRLYNERHSDWDIYNGRPLADLEHGIPSDGQPPANTNSPLRPSSANNVAHTVLGSLNLNGQASEATQDAIDAVELTSPSEKRPTTHQIQPPSQVTAP